MLNMSSLAGVPVDGRYYVSSILQKDDASLSKFYEKVPFAEVDLLRQAKATHDDGVWLFVACNKRPPGIKPKRKAEVLPCFTKYSTNVLILLKKCRICCRSPCTADQSTQTL
jgi:hypothetical protein